MLLKISSNYIIRVTLVLCWMLTENLNSTEFDDRLKNILNDNHIPKEKYLEQSVSVLDENDKKLKSRCFVFNQDPLCAVFINDCSTFDMNSLNRASNGTIFIKDLLYLKLKDSTNWRQIPKFGSRDDKPVSMVDEVFNSKINWSTLDVTFRRLIEQRIKKMEAQLHIFEKTDPLKTVAFVKAIDAEREKQTITGNYIEGNRNVSSIEYEIDKTGFINKIEVYVKGELVNRTENRLGLSSLLKDLEGKLQSSLSHDIDDLDIGKDKWKAFEKARLGPSGVVFGIAPLVKDRKSYVLSVLPGSSAERAGIPGGVEIIEINGEKVDFDTSAKLLAFLNSMDAMSLKVVDKTGKISDFKIKKEPIK